MNAKNLLYVLLLSVSVCGFSQSLSANTTTPSDPRNNKAAIAANEALLYKLVCAEYLTSRDVRAKYATALPARWELQQDADKAQLIFGEQPLTCGGMSSADLGLLTSLETNASQFQEAVVKPLFAGKKADAIDTKYFLNALKNYPSTEKVQLISSVVNETGDAHVKQTNNEVHEYILLALKQDDSSEGHVAVANIGGGNGSGTAAVASAAALDANSEQAKSTRTTANGANGARAAALLANAKNSAVGGSNNFAANGAITSVLGADGLRDSGTNTNGSSGYFPKELPPIAEAKQEGSYYPSVGIDTKKDSSDGIDDGLYSEGEHDGTGATTGTEHCTAEDNCEDVLKGTTADAYQKQMTLAVNPSPAFTYRNQAGYQDNMQNNCVGDGNHCEKSENGWKKAVEAAKQQTPVIDNSTLAENKAAKKSTICSWLGYKLPCKFKK